MDKDSLKKIISHSKEYGFIFPSSEIYEGLNAIYDYAHNGALLKNNIREYWWKSMIQLNENIVGIDSAIFMHPKTWVASGHVDAFNDPLIDNKDSKKRYRADVLIEEFIEKLNSKIQKEVQKAEKRFKEKFDKDQFLNTSPKVIEITKQIDELKSRMISAFEKDDLAEVKKIIEDMEIKCPISGTCNWTEVRQFNLMFSTKLGASEESSMDLYLRPETAQGIFLNVNYSIGVITFIISVIVLIMWIPLKQKPGIGTILNALIIAGMIDLCINFVPSPESYTSQIILAIVAVLTVGIGGGIYLVANLGPGPRDGLMIGLQKVSNLPIATVRAFIEISVVSVGWYLGGTVGIGTLLFAFGIGPAVALGLYLVDKIFNN